MARGAAALNVGAASLFVCQADILDSHSSWPQTWSC